MKASKGVHSLLWGAACDPILPRNRAQIRQLVELDEVSSPQPWTADRYRVELSKANVSCWGVTLDDGRLAGYAIIRNGHLKATVTDILVHKDLRRNGVGRMLLGCIDARVLNKERRVLEFIVGERDLGTQFFLRECCVRATDVLHNEDGGDGRYVFLATHGFSDGCKGERS